MNDPPPLSVSSRLLGALAFGLIGCVLGFFGGLIVGFLACWLHIGGNLCGMAGLLVFPPIGCAVLSALGLIFGLWKGPSGGRSRKPN